MAHLQCAIFFIIPFYCDSKDICCARSDGYEGFLIFSGILDT